MLTKNIIQQQVEHHVNLNKSCLHGLYNTEKTTLILIIINFMTIYLTQFAVENKSVVFLPIWYSS